jgi:AraC-like DNA-binding protein
MVFTMLELLDLFFRFTSIGCLSFIVLFWIEKGNKWQLIITRTLLICLSGYLMLTAPIDDKHYGAFRGVVLMLTELLPYVLWLYVYGLLHPHSTHNNFSKWARVFGLLTFFWFIYFFVVLQGKGNFHQFNHLLGIVLYIHITYMVSHDFSDDLVEYRRKVRVAMALFFGGYSSLLAVMELTDYSLRTNSLFSALNSCTILLCILLFSGLTARSKSKYSEANIVESAESSITPVLDDIDIRCIPLIFRSDVVRMRGLMQQGYYKESNLTVSALADKMKMPEHRLRQLINQHLGYQNFSAFLNSYRIPAACQTLTDTGQLRLPIISIAMDLGYGSIGPFNRAFKQMMGSTPSDFRNNSNHHKFSK